MKLTRGCKYIDCEDLNLIARATGFPSSTTAAVVEKKRTGSAFVPLVLARGARQGLRVPGVSDVLHGALQIVLRISGFVKRRLQNLTLLSEVTQLLHVQAGMARSDHGYGGQRITLHTCLLHSRPGLSHFAKQLKLSVRTVVHYHQTRQWLAYWNATPMHAKLAQATPRLLQKIYRPYQSLRLRRQDRLNILVSHYDFIFRQGLGPLVLCATQAPVLLGSFSGKSGTVYELRLSAIDRLDREGELTLDLCSDQKPLFSVAFTFHGNEQALCVGVGCLQGPRGSDSQERVRSATRDMFGLRPKSLMLRLVREIGRAYGCKKLILVGNQNRVMFHQIRTGQVFADYDDFWQEIGAIRRLDGEYQLSCDAIAAPNLQAIPSHKRSEARKRIELTERVVQAALTGFSSIPGGESKIDQTTYEQMVLATIRL